MFYVYQFHHNRNIIYIFISLKGVIFHTPSGGEDNISLMRIELISIDYQSISLTIEI